MREMICIVCPRGCRLNVDPVSVTVTGASCNRGVDYAKKELTSPERMLTGTVAVTGGMYARIPVRTSRAVPKSSIEHCMSEIKKIKAACPIKSGDILLKNIADTGADLIATRSM